MKFIPLSMLVCVLSVFVFSAHAQEKRTAQRYTTLTTALEKLSPEQRTRLAQNPDQLSLEKLNQSVSALNAIEFDQSRGGGASPHAKELRVVAWNIERGRHWREAAKLLQEHPEWKDAEVLLISEMDLGMERSNNENTTRELATALNMNYAYGVEFLELWEGGKRLDGTNAQQDYGYHGNAILSRYSLQNVRMIRFPGIERWWGTDQHRLGGRNAIFAEITTPSGTVTVVSTHLESAFGDTPMRMEEIQMIADELQPGNPVILGGDLNAIPNSKPITLLRNLGFELDSCNLLEEGTSQGVKKDGSIGRFMHIDYLAVRGLKAHSPAVLDAVYQKDGKSELISDHAAVAAIVAWASRP